MRNDRAGATTFLTAVREPLAAPQRIQHSHKRLPVWQAFVSGVRRWWAMQQLKSAVRLERKELLDLSDEQLRDIGIDRAQALRESARDSGDLPADRLSLLDSD